MFSLKNMAVDHVIENQQLKLGTRKRKGRGERGRGGFQLGIRLQLKSFIDGYDERIIVVN